MDEQERLPDKCCEADRGRLHGLVRLLRWEAPGSI